MGPIAKWKDWDFWTVDWSQVRGDGTYVIECTLKAGAEGKATGGTTPGAGGARKVHSRADTMLGGRSFSRFSWDTPDMLEKEWRNLHNVLVGIRSSFRL